MFISPFDTEIIFMVNQVFNAGLSGHDIKQFQSLQKQYANTRFADILSSNPYLTYNRNQSFWEKALSAFGFRTNYDRDLEQQANAFKEYNAQVAQLASEDEYNSPSAQAARMRQAGLNPDLIGLSGVAGASEFAAEQTSPQYSGGAEGSLSALASTCMDVFSAAMGFSKDLGALKVLKNQYDSGDIDNASKMIDVALKAANLGDTDSSDPHKVDIFTNAYSNTFFKSRSNRRSFKQAFNNAAYSLQHKAEHYKNKASVSTDKTADARNRASQYWTDSSDEDFDKAMNVVISDLVRAEENAYKKEVRNRDKSAAVKAQELQNTEEYLQNVDPSQQAAAEVAEQAAREGSAAYEVDTNRVLRDIIHDLSKEALNGNNSAAIMILLFSIFRGKVGL